jgi:hypothetical protein
VSRFLIALAVVGAVLASAASSQGETLLVASDPSQIQELVVAKVMAAEAPFWLGVRLRGKARLALVTGDSALESAPAADAWLRALDFTTRVRVAPPPGPLASCGSSLDFGVVDTGLPDPPVVDVERVETVGSELELRRALQDVGLQVEPERVARFASSVAPPFRILLYTAEESGTMTAAVRVHDVGNPNAAPRIEVAFRDTVPLSLIALASAAVLPAEAVSADPSEFSVTYRASSSTNPGSDYLSARASWLLDQPRRWLVEVQNSSALFAWTVFAPSGALAPVAARYFQGLTGSCATEVQRAHADGSRQIADYVCGDHDDLALSLAQLGFDEPKLSRLYGSLGSDGVMLQVALGGARSPLLRATDIDTGNCPPPPSGAPTGAGGMSSPDPRSPVIVSDPGPASDYGPEPGTRVYTDDGSCNVVIVDSESCSGDSSPSEPDSSDSCTGDSSASDSSSSDSCTGDSSSADGAPDSCSGDSSSDQTNDSCSGNSDTSSDASDGCSKNDGYDGDTCSGNSHSSAEATQASSAALRADGRPRNRKPRRVHLSLLTLLAAALALPFRRLRGLRC